MINLTQLNGTEIFLNPDLFEKMEEVPETHITLNNGNGYIVLEPATIVIEKIVKYKSRILEFSQSRQRRFRKRAVDYHPFCYLDGKSQEGH